MPISCRYRMVWVGSLDVLFFFLSKGSLDWKWVNHWISAIKHPRRKKKKKTRLFYDFFSPKKCNFTSQKLVLDTINSSYGLDIFSLLILTNKPRSLIDQHLDKRGLIWCSCLDLFKNVSRNSLQSWKKFSFHTFGDCEFWIRCCNHIFLSFFFRGICNDDLLLYRQSINKAKHPLTLWIQWNKTSANLPAQINLHQPKRFWDSKWVGVGQIESNFWARRVQLCTIISNFILRCPPNPPAYKRIDFFYSSPLCSHILPCV